MSERASSRAGVQPCLHNVLTLTCGEPPRACGQRGAPLAAFDVDAFAGGVPPCISGHTGRFSAERGERAADRSYG